METTSPLGVGDLVAGKYRLDRQIGAGGMGIVFAATHVPLEQPVAIKLLFIEAAQNPELVARFWREARAVAKIQSEHVARVIDLGQLPESETPYMVMEYLEGDDLENIVKRNGPLPIGDAIRYLVQVCEALAEVHTHGIVHRDIKPANLFLADRPDGTSMIKLLDFGISKVSPAWTGQPVGSLTGTAAVIGSPRYMSPEQLRSSRDVDPRSDIWALGVTLFELLGGSSPFARGTMPEVCASILKDDPLPLSELRPAVTRELETVIRRCLTKNPEARYPNVAELAVALRPFGPLGIIDISIERVVGVIARGKGRTTSPPPPRTEPHAASTTAERKRLSIPPANLDELVRDCWARIGSPTQIPRLVMTQRQLQALAPDHRTQALLALIDGMSTMDELIDVSGMSQLDTLRLVCELLDQGVLALHK